MIITRALFTELALVVFFRRNLAFRFSGRVCCFTQSQCNCASVFQPSQGLREKRASKGKSLKIMSLTLNWITHDLVGNCLSVFLAGAVNSASFFWFQAQAPLTSTNRPFPFDFGTEATSLFWIHVFDVGCYDLKTTYRGVLCLMKAIRGILIPIF